MAGATAPRSVVAAPEPPGRRVGEDGRGWRAGEAGDEVCPREELRSLSSDARARCCPLISASSRSLSIGDAIGWPIVIGRGGVLDCRAVDCCFRSDQEAERQVDMIQFKCPHCEKAFRLNDSYAGKSAKCAGCGQRIMVPGVRAPPALPAAAHVQAKSPSVATVPSEPKDFFGIVEASAVEETQPIQDGNGHFVRQSDAANEVPEKAITSRYPALQTIATIVRCVTVVIIVLTFIGWLIASGIAMANGRDRAGFGGVGVQVGKDMAPLTSSPAAYPCSFRPVVGLRRAAPSAFRATTTTSGGARSGCRNGDASVSSTVRITRKSWSSASIPRSWRGSGCRQSQSTRMFGIVASRTSTTSKSTSRTTAS